MPYRKAFFVLLAANLTALLLIAWGLWHNRLYERIWKKFTQAPYTPNWQNEVEKHRQLYTDTMNVVMLGNSITYECNWSELLGRADVANRGIPGDVTQGMLARIGAVLQLKPKVVFLEAGINDILSGYPLAGTRKNYRALIDAILESGTKPVITLTFYTRYEQGENQQVESLNEFLRQYAKSVNIPVIDLSPVFHQEGRLKLEYTHDGVHLNAAGYRIWADAVAKELQLLGI